MATNPTRRHRVPAGRPHGCLRGAAASLLILPVLSGCAGVISTGAEPPSQGCEPEDIMLVESGRGLQNEYYVATDAGARAFAKSKGMLDQYQWISIDGDSSKQLAQIKSILARSGPCTVLNVDVNESATVPSIVEEVEKSGAWVVTQWNKPDGTSPQASGEHWVAHMSVDGVPQGLFINRAVGKGRNWRRWQRDPGCNDVGVQDSITTQGPSCTTLPRPASTPHSPCPTSDSPRSDNTTLVGT